MGSVCSLQQILSASSTGWKAHCKTERSLCGLSFDDLLKSVGEAWANDMQNIRDVVSMLDLPLTSTTSKHASDACEEKTRHSVSSRLTFHDLLVSTGKAWMNDMQDTWDPLSMLKLSCAWQDNTVSTTCECPLPTPVCASAEVAEQPTASFTFRFFYSSPLCINRNTVVRLTADMAKSGDVHAAARSHVKSWGLDFHIAAIGLGTPPVVSHIHHQGLLMAWNMQAEAEDSMIRSGDVLVFLRVSSDAGGYAGARLRGGQAPEVVLSKLFDSFSQRDGHQPAHVELHFQCLRRCAQLRIDEEVGILREVGCQFKPQAATTEAIRAAISQGECQILHFSFHTSSGHNQLVCLEDGNGLAQGLTATQFLELLSMHDQQEELSIRLVFISSCHSFALGRHIATVVKHVICVRDAVLDSSCQLFEKHFFLAIKAGRSVQQAFSCGIKVLMFSPNKRFQADAEQFVLLPDDGAHDEVLHAHAAPSGKAREACWGPLPARTEDYVGREVDMYKFLCLLNAGSQGRRCTEICGSPGIGKSAFMSSIGHFLRFRCNLFHEVRWLELGRKSQFDILCEYEQGLKDLRRRLLHAPRWRALLLVRDPDLLLWEPLRHLLNLQGAYIVFRSVPDEHMMADIRATVTSAGAKPVRFVLGPLEPLAQARLFMRRAGRPIYKSEVMDEEENRADSADKEVWHVQRPADYLLLAASKLLRPHGGNPQNISQAAQQMI